MNTNDHLRALIFDMDGTMFDTLPSLQQATNEVLKHAGLALAPMETLRANVSKGLRPMFQSALALRPQPVDTDAAQVLEERFMDTYQASWLDTAPVFEGLLPALNLLRAKGFKFAICTNRDRQSTSALLSNAGISNLFDVVVCIDDTSMPKPVAAPLILTLRLLGVSADQALLIGDSSADSLCAKAAEVAFAAHLRGYAIELAELAPNVFSFNQYHELSLWLSDQLKLCRECADV